MKIKTRYQKYEEQINELKLLVNELKNDRLLLRAMMAAQIIENEVVSDMLHEIERNQKTDEIPPLWD
jgi:hypothetical protein